MEVDELRITTLAGTREMYMRTHHGIRNDTFDTLQDNLMYLSSQKGAAGSKKPAVTLINVIISQNFKELFEFAEFANQVGADKVSFQPLDTFDDMGLLKMKLTEEQTISVREELMKLKPYLSSKGIDHNINHFLKIFMQDLDTMELYRLIPCYIGWLGIRLQINGEVNLCCRCYESLGNIFEKSIQEIWYGKIYQKFRNEALEISRRRTPLGSCDCQSCPHYTLNLKVHKYIHPFKGGLSKGIGLIL
jgi:MoaA/NifB/PqqE/SkfB family radical SAM enzyme